MNKLTRTWQWELLITQYTLIPFNSFHCPPPPHTHTHTHPNFLDQLFFFRLLWQSLVRVKITICGAQIPWFKVSMRAHCILLGLLLGQSGYPEYAPTWCSPSLLKPYSCEREKKERKSSKKWVKEWRESSFRASLIQSLMVSKAWVNYDAWRACGGMESTEMNK